MMSKEIKMKTSIIVPCYNEEMNIRALYDAVCEVYQHVDYTYELVFVNDGSTDRTSGILKNLYESNKEQIVVINFSRNFGKEAAIYAGLKYASGSLISIMDADLQQSPQYLIEMIDFLNNNPDYDMVAMYQEKRREGFIISAIKRHFYKWINKMSEVDFYNGASDFRTFRKPVAEALLEMPEYFRFSKGMFSWVGFNTYYISYTADKRYAGSSKWTFGKLLKYGVGGMMSFSTFPLRLALYLGIAISGGALLYMIVVIFEYFFSAIDVPGYATIVCLILLLGGIQLMMLGVIGEYLSKTYIQGKHRPIYIAREILKDEKEL